MCGALAEGWQWPFKPGVATHVGKGSLTLLLSTQRRRKPPPPFLGPGFEEKEFLASTDRSAVVLVPSALSAPNPVARGQRCAQPWETCAPRTLMTVR